MAEVREHTAEEAEFLQEVMPTEHGRQAAAVENYFTAYAEHREIMDAITLTDQHGFCQSVGNKASLGHGDAGNQNQFNVLIFSAPARIERMYEADPTIDLGVWGMEDGELFVPFVPRLKITFNSSASHACVPKRELLRYMTDYKGMLREGNKYANECYEAALEAVRADATLMEGFAHEEDAAWYHSSIVGTTSFQQRSVTNNILRAGAFGEASRVLRPLPEVCELEAAVEAISLAKPEMSPEERRAALADARAAKKAAEKAAEEAMRERISSLVVGQRLRVVWDSGETCVGQVVEVLMALEMRDVEVKIHYPEVGKTMPERLGKMTWHVLR